MTDTIDSRTPRCAQSAPLPLDETPSLQELSPDDDVVIGKAFRWSLLVLGVGIAAVAGGISIANREKPAAPLVETIVTPPRVVERSADPPQVTFIDITAEAGIDFVHVNGATGEKMLPESLGGGVAFLDYDSDGDQDLLFINSDYWPGHAPSGTASPTMALYSNDSSGRFENVTAGSGLDLSFYGMGAAVGDYNNDGWVDVFVSALGTNYLFRNKGRRFEQVTTGAGVAGDSTAWSTCATFFDSDNDGDLDLFVGNYVQWSREIDLEVNYTLVGIGRAYGPPMNFRGHHPYLYRNNGDGTFEDITAVAGMAVTNKATGVPVGKTLGVVPFDLDGDGWMDLVVANDTVRNFFFRNNQDGTFTEQGVDTGLAYDMNGSATGAMGLDIAHYRNNEDIGLFIGNFANEMTSLYVSQGDMLLFADEAISEGIGSPSRLMLTFGLFLFDYDLDGRLDLLQANGHLEEEINIVQPSQNYEQPPQLFWNTGKSRRCFATVDPATTGDLSTPIVGRGSSYADIDGDGDLDVVFTQVGRRPLLLRNDQQFGNRWLRLKLVGDWCNRDAIGTIVEAEVGDTVQRRMVNPTRSYLSQVELPITFGLSDAESVDRLTITWPSGQKQTFTNLPADIAYLLHEGEKPVGVGP
ncbi:MAG: CRTAC1 family protein [Phycisphaerales bacterium]|nr:MAG: CRTAC1 family protein [Phycisphaerales bacterium]